MPISPRVSTSGAVSLRALLRRPVLVGLAAVATVFLTTAALTTLVLAVLVPRVDRADDVLLALQDGHVAMVNQETGLRGFLITRQPQFLQPYEAGAAELERLDAQLLAWSAGDEDLRGWVQTLHAAEQRWIDGFALPLLVAQPAPGASAELSAMLVAEKALFDDYRVVQAEVRVRVQDRRDDAVLQQRAVLLAGVGSAFLVTLAAAFLVRRANRRLAGQILPPVHGVRVALASMTQGDLGRRAPVAGPAEVQDIAGDVNELGAALLERSELVAARERELEAARDEAEQAGQAKTAFLATMSHEIRTPLNAVLGLTDLLLTTDLTREQRGHLETVSRSGDSLLTLINDVLDFSKIEAGELDLELAPFDLSDLVYDVAHLFAPQAARKGLDLLVDIDATRSWQVVGDGPRLRQVVLNLVANAVKFTAVGQVVVSVHGPETDGRVDCRLAVSDTGIGIPDDRRHRLFQSFSQVDGSTTRTYGGTGLGLAISQRIAGAMGGEILVDSVLGTGSTFTVALELELATTVAVPASSTALAGRRLLIVDDNPTNLRILEHQLTRYGATCAVADGAHTALELLDRLADGGHRVHAAVLDQHMPGVDGNELARRIRRRDVGGDLPLVLLSSSTEAHPDTDRLFAARLHKPARPERMLLAVRSVLQPATWVAEPHRSGGEEPHEPGPGARLRVLVAEDHDVNAQLIELYLAQLGHDGVRVTNGREAVEAVQAGSFDVVLMDAQMPVLGGVEATAAIRALPGPQPCVIAVTASALASDRASFLAAGAADFLTKPVRLRTLEEALGGLANQASRAAADRVPAPVPAAEEASGTDPVLDPGTVEELRELGEDGFEHVYRRYLAGLEDSVAALVAAASGDLSDLDGDASVPRLAHRLKGSSASLGAGRLAELCRRLEDAAESAAPRYEGTIAELEAESRRVGAAVSTLLASLPGPAAG
ncbi:response regulator [Modestobacter sp. I12A-02628]|uniref:Circadian input-output histidine kinase CikA n=1 Tax=Goekera deserti TaxID=2497753 RepID=A0A7K3WI31_9ACTN|nr:response regulator [Goekera deserti]MPQ97830.1 response regulator [Goekera deserti]NDI48475.1 response regulator [Goekera deserti]NEL56077.1 response regulator [Goekera deserti]